MSSQQHIFITDKGNSFVKNIFKFFRRKDKKLSARDTIEELIEDNEDTEQSIAQNEKEMIGNVLDLRNTKIQDIMLPRASIIAVPVNSSIENILETFVENQISTILVYQDALDNVIGVLHLKDVANWIHMNKPFNSNNFIKEVLFVPPAMHTLNLLFKMKETGIKTAVVIDEYGGVDGFVSFIDLIEEIIGDIKDATEIKHKKKKIIKSKDGAIIVDGQSTFDEIKKYGGMEIMPVDDSDTIGGMLFSMLGRLPVRGELITLPEQKLEFEVLEADPRKIKTLKIKYINNQNLAQKNHSS